MDGSIRLSTDERKWALDVLRRGSDPELRLRAHILLLLYARQQWALIVAVLFTSTSTINRWRRRFLDGGLATVLGQTRPVRSRWWVALIVRWVTEWTPSHFGFVRSRWTCEAVAIVLREDHRAAVVTPGNNEKRYLSGSLNWWTGELILTEGKPGQGRNTELFLAHLDELLDRVFDWLRRGSRFAVEGSI